MLSLAHDSALTLREWLSDAFLEMSRCAFTMCKWQTRRQAFLPGIASYAPTRKGQHLALAAFFVGAQRRDVSSGLKMASLIGRSEFPGSAITAPSV